MALKVKIKRCATTGITPTTTDLSAGELGVNMADSTLFFGTGTEVKQIVCDTGIAAHLSDTANSHISLVEKQALDAASNPSTTNPVATLADIKLNTGLSASYLFCDDVIFADTTPVWHELEKQSDGGAAGFHTATTNAYVEMDRYVTAPLNTSIIPAGIWGFTMYAKLSGVQKEGMLQAVIHRVSSAGVIVTTLGTATTAPFTNIVTTAIQMSVWIAEQSDWELTDRIGIVVYGKRGAEAGTMTWYHDITLGFGSEIQTPLVLLHNQLAGLNQDDYQHITVAEKTYFTNKQATLVSGTTIKTINYNSILGSGNIEITSGNNTSAATAVFRIGQNVGHTSYVFAGTEFPFAIANGTTDNIPLTNSAIPFLEASGATDNIQTMNVITDRYFAGQTAEAATPYIHPTSDGSLHVPETGTTNSGNVLTAGSTAGSLIWVAPYYAVDWANPITIVNTAATLTIGKHHIISHTGDVTMTLPPAAESVNALVSVEIMQTASNALVAIAGSGTDLVNGLAYRQLIYGETAILRCDGSRWYKIAGRNLPLYYYAQGTNNTSATPYTITKITLTSLTGSTNYFSLSSGGIRSRREIGVVQHLFISVVNNTATNSTIHPHIYKDATIAWGGTVAAPYGYAASTLFFEYTPTVGVTIYAKANTSAASLSLTAYVQMTERGSW